MMHPDSATLNYRPRDTRDAGHAVYHARLTECLHCPLRHGHECRIANQLCSILARPAAAVCPNGSWPGDARRGKPDESGSQDCESRPADRLATGLPLRARSFPDCAAIIISHNYGRFLADALASVMSQTVKPAEVLIVDDASDDGTPAIAAQLQQRYGSLVRYVRIDVGHVHAAMRAGFLATSAQVVCFLDADDLLPPDYLAAGLPLLADPVAGVVYSDMERFGAEAGVSRFRHGNIDAQNFIHNGSLVRRAAVEASGAFDESVDFQSMDRAHQDWYLWRRVLACGWSACKSPALYRYRRHTGQASQRPPRSYFDCASLALETITLFVPLSGRHWAWPAMREFLERQDWPHDQTRLVLCDTSPDDDDAFTRDVRRWLTRSDYTDTRWYAQGLGANRTNATNATNLADADRRDPDVRREVQAAMPRIYNRLAREASTEYVWVVEDDIAPPLDAARRLLSGFEHDVASVSGVYESRFMSGRWVAWQSDCIQMQRIEAGSPGLLQVHGNGFGCVMLRRSVLRETVFQHAVPTGDYDPNFYHWLAGTRWHARLDTRILCEHSAAPPLPLEGSPWACVWLHP